MKSMLLNWTGHTSIYRNTFSMKSMLLFCCFQFSTFLLLGQDLYFSRENPDPDLTWSNAWELATDESGNIYISTSNGYVYRKSNGVWEGWDLASDDFTGARGVAADAEGTIWAATEESLYAIDDGQITKYTSDNSDLPPAEYHELAVFGNQLWISVFGNGLALKEGDTFTHFTKANSGLMSDFLNDLAVLSDGTLIALSSDDVHFYKNGVWTAHDVDDILDDFGSNANSLYVDHNEDVWISTRNGLLMWDNSENTFHDLQEEYGDRYYLGVIHTPQGELWMGGVFDDGTWHFDPNGNEYFFPDPMPSQVTGFIFYQDSVRLTGNTLGNALGTVALIYPDNDEDGYSALDDCDDTNPDVNPAATEIPYNGIDDDCNAMTFDDDLDQDGYNLEDDCDDTNENINPAAMEVPNNGIDEDCDGMDLVNNVVEASDLGYAIFPNPTTEFIYITAPVQREATYTVSNSTGAIVISTAEGEKIDVSSLPAGVYTLSIRDYTLGKTGVAKIVIKR